jgi:hypothetical protein
LSEAVGPWPDLSVVSSNSVSVPRTVGPFGATVNEALCAGAVPNTGPFGDSVSSWAH